MQYAIETWLLCTKYAKWKQLQISGFLVRTYTVQKNTQTDWPNQRKHWTHGDLYLWVQMLCLVFLPYDWPSHTDSPHRLTPPLNHINFPIINIPILLLPTHHLSYLFNCSYRAPEWSFFLNIQVTLITTPFIYCRSPLMLSQLCISHFCALRL